MHILFLVPYAPTPIRTRPYNLLRGLLRRGHRVTLATLWENGEERAYLEDWEQDGVKVVASHLPKLRSLWNSLCALPGATPLQAVYCWQPALLASLTRELASDGYDVIHVEHLRGARYGLWLQSVNGHSSSAPIIWDSVDCITHLFQQAAHSSTSVLARLMTRLELERTRRYEAWLSGQFDRILVTSPVDKDAFECLNSGALERSDVPLCERITVLPNGVDLDHFCPATAPRQPNSIVFSGKMSYHANVTAVLHFSRDILPRIWGRIPGATFTIVGHNPPAEVRALSADPRITVTGSVPDLCCYLQRAFVAVAPMPYGAGIQNKVLEAMACATPVVATPQAISALQAQPGRHLLVSQEPDEFARAVIRLLVDSDLRQRIGRAGRQYVEEHHDWNAIVGQLEAIYGEAMPHNLPEVRGEVDG